MKTLSERVIHRSPSGLMDKALAWARVPSRVGMDKPPKVLLWASLVAQLVKNLSAMQETCVRSLDWEDPLEKEMETHSSILAWRIPWTEEPDRL